MGNPLFTLVALIFALTYPTGHEPLWALGAEEGRTLFPLLGCALVTVLYASACALLLRRGMSAARFMKTRLALRMTALVLYAAEIFVLHFPHLAEQTVGLGPNILTTGLVLLVPFLALNGIQAVFASRVESRIRAVESRAAARLFFALRGFAAFSLLPAVFLLGAFALMIEVPLLKYLGIVYPFSEVAFFVLLLALFLTLVPIFLAVTLGARPLPEGPRRDRLFALCRAAGFRCRNLLVIPTYGSRIANAFITGLLPPLRHVFFTDALLERMDEEAIESVLAHEIAHATRRHLLFYFLFCIAYLSVATFVFEQLRRIATEPGVVEIAMIGFAVFVWVFVFGSASRRFEAEADFEGVRIIQRSLPPDADPYEGLKRFSRALVQVAEVNATPHDARSLLHFSVSGRLMLLHLAVHHEGVGHRLVRTCVLMRRAVLVLLAASSFYWGNVVGRNLDDVPRNRNLYEAVVAAEEGIRLYRGKRYEEAAPFLEAAVEGYAYKYYYDLHFLLADALDEAGRTEEALRWMQRARSEGARLPGNRLRMMRNAGD